MSNLTEIAKENGAFVYSDGHIGLHPHQLQATVEQVCKPLVRQIIDLIGESNAAGWLGEIDDMAHQVIIFDDDYRKLNRTITKAIREGVNCLEDFRKLIGHDK